MLTSTLTGSILWEPAVLVSGCGRFEITFGKNGNGTNVWQLEDTRTAMNTNHRSMAEAVMEAEQVIEAEDATESIFDDGGTPRVVSVLADSPF